MPSNAGTYFVRAVLSSNSRSTQGMESVVESHLSSYGEAEAKAIQYSKIASAVYRWNEAGNDYSLIARFKKGSHISLPRKSRKRHR